MAPIPARRRNGICSGSLWKQHTSVTTPPNFGSVVSMKSQDDDATVETLTALLYGNARSRTHDYCVLVGDTLCSYSDVLCYSRGDHPTSEVRIVGASAWNPKAGRKNETTKSNNSSLLQKSLSSSSLASTVTSLASEVSQTNDTTISHSSATIVPATGPPTFRLLTHVGTHVYCIAPSATDRDIWLSALHSALESSYASMQEVLSSICASNKNPNNQNGNKDDNHEKPLYPTGNHVKLTHQQQILTPPVPKKRSQISFRRRLNQSFSFTTASANATNGTANSCFTDPYNNDVNGQQSKTHCLSCGRYPPESAMPAHSTTPLPHYGMETRVNVCRPCLISQGVLRHVLHMASVYATDAHERASLTQARDMAYKVAKKGIAKHSTTSPTESAMDSNNTSEDKTDSDNLTNDADMCEIAETPSSDQIEIPSEVDITSSLIKLIQNPKFQSFRRRSKSLNIHCRSFENSDFKFVPEFLETLNEHAKEASASSIALSTSEELRLKKEAFKISGDVGAALKTLHDAALPLKRKKNGNNPSEGISIHSNYNCTEMIVCILEYFLDLCEEGELASIAFFWPQLRQIHLQMLPPTDAGSLIRMELMEDFLLTVSVKYSVNLSLELLWGCIADLEESLVPTSTTPNHCRRRRYSLIRFICELESLIFDFDGGWGGGTISLGAMLNPTNDQALLIKEAMSCLQIHRRFSSHHLRRSVRLEKLQSEAELVATPSSSPKSKTKNPLSIDKVNKSSVTVPWRKQNRLQSSDVEAAKMKCLIARNADYFSTQIMFSRRLGDIAEKLRFMDVEKRSAALEDELNILNSSGRMGGDPLNRLCLDGEGLINALHIPSTEGHVFRSKERTPVLLLLEVVREENPFALNSKDDLAEIEQIEDDNIKPGNESQEHNVVTEGNSMALQKSQNLSSFIANQPLIAEPNEPRPKVENNEKDSSITITGDTEDKEDTKVAQPVLETSETDKSLENESRSITNKSEEKVMVDSTDIEHVTKAVSELAVDLNNSKEDDGLKPAKDDANDMDVESHDLSNGEVTLKSEVAGTTENLSESCDDGKSKDESSHENMDIVRVSDESVEKVTNLIDVTENGVVAATEEITITEESLDIDSKVTKSNVTGLDESSKTEFNTAGEDTSPEVVLEIETNLNKSKDDAASLPSEAEESPLKVDVPTSHQKFSGVLPSPKNKKEAPDSPSVESVGDLVANMMNKKLVLPELDNKLLSGADKDSLPTNEVEGNSDINKLTVEDDDSRKVEVAVNSETGIKQEQHQQKQDVKVSSALVPSQKQSTVGVFASTGSQRALQSSALSASLANLSAQGDGRREVLTAIMMKGMKSSNLIARGAAPIAQRAIQAMAYRKAQLMMSDGVEVQLNDKGNDDLDLDSNDVVENFNTKPGVSTSVTSVTLQQAEIFDETELSNLRPPSEEDECMESLRLLLIQHRVAQGNLSPEKAALALAPESSGTKSAGAETSENQVESTVGAYDDPVDAGEIDPRLSGCGTVSFAVLSALKLWRQGIVSNHELLELVQKDIQYTRIALPGAENENKLIEDSKFWGRFSFGERWNEKKARIQASSEYGSNEGWDLRGVIVKSNDDLRQEAFIMQLIELSREAFAMSDLELWVQPYTILATGRTTGIIEMVHNAMSFDSLKKRPGYSSGGLSGHFKRMAEVAADPEEALVSAQKNFVRSLAAYSLLSYLFLFKDRHNGNLLLDTAGHVIHIDFGFVFGIAPGGSFSLEQSAPFKLTEEMIELMGGVGSALFTEFVTLFCCGFLALQAHAETFCTLVEITCDGCSFKCFEGKDPNEIVTKLRDRFCTQFDKETTIAFAMDLINQASTSYGTKQYDYFQYLSNGIAQ